MFSKAITVTAAAALSVMFVIGSAKAQPAGRLIVNQLSGKCLDVPGISNFTPGTPLQLWDCEVSGREPNGKPSDQFWVFGPQGNIRNTLSGLCIDITSSNNATPLQIAACDGRESQLWVVRQDGFIQNQITGKCIDVLGYPGVNTGTPLQLVDCEHANPQTDQRWRY